jgi:hypothetical protein
MYKSLSIEIQQMWNMQYMIIPVIFGATGIVLKGLKKSLENFQEKYAIDSLPKTATLEA